MKILSTFFLTGILPVLCCAGCITFDTPSSAYLGQRSAQGTNVYVNSNGGSAYASSATSEWSRTGGAGGSGGPGGSGGSGTGAGAGGSLDQPVETLLVEIRAAYRKGASDTVVETARAILTYASATPRQRAEAMLYAGCIQYTLGDTTRAYGYFREAVRQDPDALPPDDIRTSGMLQEFMRARRDECGQ